MSSPDTQQTPEARASRRGFLKAGGGAASLLLAGGVPAVHAGGSSMIKVGLIGCGGRGTGAARDCIVSSPGVELTAMGDMFPDRLESSLRNLGEQEGRVKVPPERRFTGFDAYQKVLQSGIDMVILATPPGFRPIHFEAAVKAGKHVFFEKPVAVDAPGVRRVIAAGEEAARKGLGVVAGTQRRHQAPYLETIKRIHGGAIGEVVGAQVYWNQGALWVVERKPEWSDMEWQLRNWYYFCWLCGDHIVEQHVHNLDVANWVLRNHPVKAVGLGGRQVRTDPKYGHIYDHFAVDFEYPNGVRVLSMCRQQDGTIGNVSERIIGTRGIANPAGQITGPNRYRFEGESVNPYVQEHTDLIASIRAGKPLNEARQIAESTLTAIMGRMACYTGLEITWEMALNSKEVLMPEKLEFGPLPVPPVPMPGKTKFV